MFKGFQSKSTQFHGFPNLNFQMNNEAYGFSGCTFWIDAAQSGLNTRTNLGAISYVTDIISGRPFIQDTAGNQPRYLESDVNFNNEPTLDFYDTARRITATNPFSIDKSKTFVWAAKVNALAANANVIMGTTLLADNKSFCTSSTNLGVSPYGAGFIFTNTTGYMSEVRSTSAQIIIMTENTILINGVSVTINGTAKDFGRLPFNQIGSTRNQANASLNGQLANLLIYSSKFSIDDMIVLSNRINTRYAIY